MCILEVACAGVGGREQGQRGVKRRQGRGGRSGSGRGLLRDSSIRKGLRQLCEHRLCGHRTPSPPLRLPFVSLHISRLRWPLPRVLRTKASLTVPCDRPPTPGRAPDLVTTAS